MVPIYSHLVAMREEDSGIVSDHKCMGLVKISLSQWTKTHTCIYKKYIENKYFFYLIFQTNRKNTFKNSNGKNYYKKYFNVIFMNLNLEVRVWDSYLSSCHHYLYSTFYIADCAVSVEWHLRKPE